MFSFIKVCINLMCEDWYKMDYWLGEDFCRILNCYNDILGAYLSRYRQNQV